MTGIEFLDEPDGLEHARRQAPPASRLRTGIVATLFTAAAALSVIAAFGSLYRIGFGPHGQQFPYGVDAMGTYHGIDRTALQGSYGARFGYALIGCAALFVALAVHVAAPLVRLPTSRRLRPAVPYLGAAVTGVLAGLTLGVYLDVSAVLASARAQTRAGVQEGDPIRGDISTHLGPGVWCALAGVGCAALAVAGPALDRARVTRRASSSPDG